ncbi:hypothetical protein [Delftia sp. CH05]|uniref:hypothetical protein n=1 Tax=Delftia sp. CH05 TaxID=2692194 RepID=UPI003FA4CC62
MTAAARGRTINTGRAMKCAPWQIAVLSPGVCLGICGQCNAGLTVVLSTALSGG